MFEDNKKAATYEVTPNSWTFQILGVFLCPNTTEHSSLDLHSLLKKKVQEQLVPSSEFDQTLFDTGHWSIDLMERKALFTNNFPTAVNLNLER